MRFLGAKCVKNAYNATQSAQLDLRGLLLRGGRAGKGRRWEGRGREVKERGGRGKGGGERGSKWSCRYLFFPTSSPEVNFLLIILCTILMLVPVLFMISLFLIFCCHFIICVCKPVFARIDCWNCSVLEYCVNCCEFMTFKHMYKWYWTCVLLHCVHFVVTICV